MLKNMESENDDSGAAPDKWARITSESSLSALARWWYRSASQKNTNHAERQVNELPGEQVGTSTATGWSSALVAPEPAARAAERARSSNAQGATGEPAVQQRSPADSPPRKLVHPGVPATQTAASSSPNLKRRSVGQITIDASAVLLSPEMLHKLVKPDMAGYLYYRWRMRWQRCWLSLDGSLLRFFEHDPRTGRRGRLIHTISLFYWDYIRTPSYSDPRRPYILEVKDAKGVVHYFAADSEEDLICWKEAFFRARSVAPPAHAIPSMAEAASVVAKTNIQKGQQTNDAVTHRRSIRGMLAEVTPPQHLICIVHGIGSDEQRLRENLKNFHDALDEVMQNTLPDALTHFGIKTIYCHWRAALRKLDVYQRMLQLNPLGDQTPSRWRTLVNNKLMDILFYLTPRIKRFIQCEVVAQLNEEYERFRQKYPEFRGDISILGHSLGSVISYELLVQQVLSDPIMLEREGLRLRFPVHNLFLTGSPLGHVLNVDDHLRSTIGYWPFRLVNIINPSDPAACRIEPILDPFFADIPPVEIPAMAGGASSWLSFQSTGRSGRARTANAKDGSADGSGSGDFVIDHDSGTLSCAPVAASTAGEQLGSAAFKPRNGTSPVQRELPEESSTGDPATTQPLLWTRSPQPHGWFPQLETVRKLVRQFRIDYVMRPNFMEDLWGLSAHLNYWRSRDVAYFIIQYILRQQLERQHQQYVATSPRIGKAHEHQSQSRAQGATPCPTVCPGPASPSPASGLVQPESEASNGHTTRAARAESNANTAASIRDDRAASISGTAAALDPALPYASYAPGTALLDASEKRLSADNKFERSVVATPPHGNDDGQARDGMPTMLCGVSTAVPQQAGGDLTKDDAERAQAAPERPAVVHQSVPPSNRLSAAYPTVRSAFMTRLDGLRAETPFGTAAAADSDPVGAMSDTMRTPESFYSSEDDDQRPASV